MKHRRRPKKRRKSSERLVWRDRKKRFLKILRISFLIKIGRLDRVITVRKKTIPVWVSLEVKTMTLWEMTSNLRLKN